LYGQKAEGGAKLHAVKRDQRKQAAAAAAMDAAAAAAGL
jgi:hypothetical protein